MDGSKSTVTVDEVTCAAKAAEGNRNPSEAGIRLGGVKYMITYHDADSSIAQLKKGNLGAATGKCATCVIVGFFDAEKQDQLGRVQNIIDCASQVQAMVEYLAG